MSEEEAAKQARIELIVANLQAYFDARRNAAIDAVIAELEAEFT